MTEDVRDHSNRRRARRTVPGTVIEAPSDPGSTTPLLLGWEEWIALPELGLPAIKAKIDTGARTSALHAEDIEPFGPPSAARVRFVIKPVPRRPEIAIGCTAPLLGRRAITSSNGIPEERFVIETVIAIGGRTWRIEISLSNRGEMNYRMLLGRQALQGASQQDQGVLIDPSTSFHQTRLGFNLYPGYIRNSGIKRRKS